MHGNRVRNRVLTNYVGKYRASSFASPSSSMLPRTNNTVRFICIIRRERPPAVPGAAIMNQKRNSNFKAGRPRPSRRAQGVLTADLSGQVTAEKFKFHRRNIAPRRLAGRPRAGDLSN